MMNPAVIAIIVSNVLVSFKGFSDRSFFERYKFQVGPIKAGEQIRMFTSGFLHADQGHLFFNMLTLYFFADVVIASLGVPKFLTIYLGSLLLGNLISLNFHKKEPYYAAVGASGAVMGILYAAILLKPDMSLYMYFIPIPIPAYIFGVGYLLYSIYGMKNRVGNIGHSAHIGGAVGGYLLTILLYPQVLNQNRMMVLVLLAPIVLLYIFRNRLNP